ncbi:MULTISPECIES: hypothetical protein [unclassified Okeania]|uniref:hypothetical protein n=1 Tax=unclassified Okeania TaxID=2634635 RepID=UPI0013B91AE3|nr:MULTISPECIES: hypothetical protein [unclassified Okeania]NET14547.1 hypothetical protein [Okeania sp. SIO1H6]NES77371.1 hypothetical protein [Okeania sp. SIO1H4]NES91285.1 hypothetical protein [Okeania sp. SIO2B9]NET20984.1 hypothetical protein [Okeania sp. SIO1H5]NET94238.1 hypothetical protein [Okeania sp. SIO1H2]
MARFPVDQIIISSNQHSYRQNSYFLTTKKYPYEVQQINLQRLDKAWKRWLIPGKAGKRGGRPRFKKSGKLRSFCFSRVNHPKAAIKFDGKQIISTRFGAIRVIVHRPIPDEFTIKTATITKKASA